MTHPGPPEQARATPDPEKQFKTDLLELIPFLRAFARSLCGNQEMADDLAQETLVKAWQARGMFAPGTDEDFPFRFAEVSRKAPLDPQA